MCRFETEWEGSDQDFREIKDRLSGLEEDGLVEIAGRKVSVTEKGIPFVRNACMAFDMKLHERTPEKPTFSKTV
ncbi:MAG TPA: hypothetical protein DD671_05710 [Balneolaceae bacterium]|nr:hypothetical protein [Balneolaceae bacterium]